MHAQKSLNIRLWLLRLHKLTLYIYILIEPVTVLYISGKAPAVRRYGYHYPGISSLFLYITSSRTSEEIHRSWVTSSHDRTTHTSTVWPCSLKIIHDEFTIEGWTPYGSFCSDPNASSPPRPPSVHICLRTASKPSPAKSTKTARMAFWNQCPPQCTSDATNFVYTSLAEFSDKAF